MGVVEHHDQFGALGDSEQDRHFWMGMENGVHLRTRLVDLRMNMEFSGGHRTGRTIENLAIEVEGEDDDGRVKGRHRGTGIGRPRFWDRASYFNMERDLAKAIDALDT